MTAPRAFSDVPSERVRAFWDARPCNIRHSPRPVGTREYFEEGERRKDLVEPHIARFAEFPRWAGKRVLEVGCGIGLDAVRFARAGAAVTAVDLSERSLDLARQRAQVLGLEDRIRFVHGDAERLRAALAPEPFDLIYSFGVLHHTPDPARALDELRAFAAPGGALKLMLYHRRSWKVLAILLTHGRGRLWDLPRVVAAHSEAQTGCPVTYTFTRREARAFVEAAGFRVTDLFVDHIFPWRIPDYVEHRHVKTWYFRLLPERLFRRLERRLGWHLCLTAVNDPDSLRSV